MLVIFSIDMALQYASFQPGKFRQLELDSRACEADSRRKVMAMID
jgi:hypothetical protein